MSTEIFTKHDQIIGLPLALKYIDINLLLHSQVGQPFTSRTYPKGQGSIHPISGHATTILNVFEIIINNS